MGSERGIEEKERERGEGGEGNSSPSVSTVHVLKALVACQLCRFNVSCTVLHIVLCLAWRVRYDFFYFVYFLSYCIISLFCFDFFILF